MKKILTILLASLLVTACDRDSKKNIDKMEINEGDAAEIARDLAYLDKAGKNENSIEERYVEMAKSAIHNQIKNSSNASFKNIRLVAPGQLCGEVNISHGNNVEFREFYWININPDEVSILDAKEKCRPATLTAAQENNKKAESLSMIFEMAKSAVSNQLKDPSSAQFRNLVEVSPGVVCGEVNAKNSFGGYAGFKRFHWTISTKEYAEIINNNDEFIGCR